MALTIKPAETKDARAISDLIIDCIRRTNAADYPAHVIELTCANFTEDRIITKMIERKTYIACLDEIFVATVSIGGSVLHSLFVSPEQQGKGIGKSLAHFVENHFVSKGISEVEVHSSITARLFYEKLGYAEIEFENRLDGSTFLMKKNLLL